ncbi:zinc finger protein 2 [Anabrus simplex]|uniref:zinc finger protein 2 n=1 Tax=Anabrus simplex TaxID=316456 RepID=UPI0035A3508E
MDLETKIKEEPAWHEETLNASPCKVIGSNQQSKYLQTINLQCEVDLETKIKEEPAWHEETLNASLPSGDIKEEIFIEQNPVDQLVPYIKEETKSCPEISYADHPHPDSGRHPQTHGEDYPVKCNHCGKLYCSRSSVSEHVEIHMDQALHECGIRSMGSTLTKPMGLHTVENRFQCPVCQKTLRNTSHLKYHSRSHTGVRPFCCIICGKAFADKGILTRHHRTHTGEKPYSCSSLRDAEGCISGPFADSSNNTLQYSKLRVGAQNCHSLSGPVAANCESERKTVTVAVDR